MDNKKEKIRYKGKFFEVITEDVDIEGTIMEFEKIRRSPGVRVIVQDKEDNILLTREFRRELEKFDHRLPGGKMFDSLDEFNEFRDRNDGDIREQAKNVARKEVEEETGFKLDTIEYFSISKLGATVEWDLYYFLAVADRSQNAKQHLEPGEHIEIVWVTKEQARNLILETDDFSEERSATTLLKFLHRR